MIHGFAMSLKIYTTLIFEAKNVYRYPIST